MTQRFAARRRIEGPFVRFCLAATTLCGLFASLLRADEPASAVGPLMKLFQSGRLPAERLSTVVEMICTRGNEHDLHVIFEKVSSSNDAFPASLKQRALQGLYDAAVTRKIVPAGDRAGLAALISGADAHQSPELQQAAIALAAAWKDASIVPSLQQLATANVVQAKTRRAAIAGLVSIASPESKATLMQLASTEQPLSVRFQAAAGLANIDLKEAGRLAAAALAAATSSDEPDELLAAFLDRKGGADQLAESIAAARIPTDVAKRSLRYIYSVGRSDAALSNALSAAAGIAADVPPPTQDEVVRIAAEVEQRGDAVRGEAVFRRKDLNCMKCHAVSRAGGQVGPDLSAVGGSSPIDYMVNSVLNPNLAVKEQFVTRIFELSTGKVLTGVVVERDEIRVVMRDASGQTLRIPTADIEEETEGRSLMPQGLTKFLTHDELIDLIRFVSELGKPGPFAVQQAKTIQRWKRLRSPPPELTADVPHLEHLRQFVLGSDPSGWESAYGRVAGVLPLEELRRPDEPPVLILQGELNVNEAGPVVISIDANVPVQTWFNSDAHANQRDVTVELAPGTHVVTLRVELPASPPPSSEPEPRLRVEVKTPANSSAVFQVTGGS